MFNDDETDYPNGPCEFCGGPLDDDYECPTCSPRERLIDTPVIASFAITDGRVSLAGWCSP